MLGRRILILMAVLLGFTALVTALAPRPTRTPERGAESASPTREPAPPTTTSRVVTQTVDATAGARPARVRARAGDTIRLAVHGDVLDTVELQGLDEIDALEPSAPARFEFLAESPGEHPIVLMDADRRVGLLVIKAAPKR
jgi:plastocyanin